MNFNVERIQVLNNNPVRGAFFSPDDEIRCYSIAGQDNPVYMPSVTTYLDATSTAKWLWEWKCKEAQKEAELPLELGIDLSLPHGHSNIYSYRGELVHNLIEAKLKGDELPDYSDVTESVAKDIPGFFKLFNEFITQYQVKPVSMEFPLYSESLRIAGRADAVVKLDSDMISGTFLIDWKTTGKLKSQSNIKDYEYQIAIYYHLLTTSFPEYLQGEKLDGTIICIACYNSDKKVNKLRPFRYTDEQMQELFNEFMEVRYKRFWDWVKFKSN